MNRVSKNTIGQSGKLLVESILPREGFSCRERMKFDYEFGSYRLQNRVH